MPWKIATIVLPIVLCIALATGICRHFMKKFQQMEDIAMSSCFYASTMVSYLESGKVEDAKDVGEAGIRESAFALVDDNIRSPGSLNFLRNLLKHKKHLFKEEEYLRIQHFLQE